MNASARGQAMFASYQAVNYVPNFITAGMRVRYEVTNTSSYSGTGTTITDLMGNANGTLYNSPVYTNSAGTYLNMSSTSSNYILTNNIGSTYNQSVFMWVYPTGNGVLLAELGQAAINSGYHAANIEISGSTIRFAIWPYTNYTPLISSSISLNTWHYVGFTYDGTTLNAYVNGASVGTYPLTRIPPANLYYGIGATDGTNLSGASGGGYGNFRFGAFHYFNRSLSANEVNLNYKLQLNRYTLTTCKDLAGSASPSGTYFIDPDGSGPNPAYQAYCDNTMDGGGWTLVAIRASSGSSQMFNETISTPLLRTAATGRLSSTAWAANSTFPFTQIKYTNDNNENATATFASSTSINALNAANTTYVSTPTTATVVSTDSRLTRFYWRAQSGASAQWSDAVDWAYMAFGNTSINFGDSWDTGQGYWILSGTDNTYDPATHTNVAVGKPAGPSSVASAHWWGSGVFVNNAGSYFTKTYVWLK